MSELRLHQVAKRYGRQPVLHGIDLHIRQGELVVFVGPSGCGKSTLLRTIAGLEEQDSGQILLDDEDISRQPPGQREMAMVFQSYALYPHMTVAEMLQLTPLLQRKPGALSGGQRQRVAIGRAIVRKPRLFLFDEPLSNLDAKLRTHTRVQLKALHQQLAATMIYVTHDQVEAMTLADRIVVLHEGRIAQVGTPEELYHQPATAFVAGFIGTPEMNFFPLSLGKMLSPGQVPSPEHMPSPDKTLSPWLQRLASDQRAATLGVRPDAFEITEGIPTFKVDLVENLGAQYHLHGHFIHEPGMKLVVESRTPVRLGQELALQVAPERCHWFDAAGQRLPQPSFAAGQENPHGA
ncbi:ABC transporter ATP-binding protein [Dickeya dianthicola]|uniref:ABC transporter ATP-binding protein n=1 Tax=Dickeya dianthicola TaxID=204039 RepID=UPI0003A23254|nr:ABC transporter ATP-binding protein [Dickeya dianthicola]ATO31835.1 Maltose maltodextrin transport ATP-bindin protein malK [Dickeya dianthicola RNS04.9]MBT1426975.1 ABC transporter ATP-binding protein [Dickeya dianthicola]MBT1431027.1 ABC transporter ATP-binding protein [Dickeya dianthicola]MBT1458494.1 ABC transporter ATP-binding protein [Dickeya dianthicola]MBT1487634.1 ABC transporter ATP-binding protein [Dickeya dianthicola]